MDWRGYFPQYYYPQYPQQQYFAQQSLQHVGFQQQQPAPYLVQQPQMNFQQYCPLQQSYYLQHTPQYLQPVQQPFLLSPNVQHQNCQAQQQASNYNFSVSSSTVGRTDAVVPSGVGTSSLPAPSVSQPPLNSATEVRPEVPAAATTMVAQACEKRATETAGKHQNVTKIDLTQELPQTNQNVTQVQGRKRRMEMEPVVAKKQPRRCAERVVYFPPDDEESDTSSEESDTTEEESDVSDDDFDSSEVHTAPSLKKPKKESETPTTTSPTNECVVCMDAATRIIFIPCGHLCCCVECSNDLKNCPMCRGAIEKKIKVIQP